MPLHCLAAQRRTSTVAMVRAMLRGVDGGDRRTGVPGLPAACPNAGFGKALRRIEKQLRMDGVGGCR